MATSRRRIVLCIAAGADPPPGWDEGLRHADIVIARGRDEARAQLADADGMFLWDFASRVLDGMPLPPRLAWIHAGSLGVDAVLTPEVAASPVTVSNTRGLFERPIAEYVLGWMLAIAKDFRASFRLQDRGQWLWRPTRGLTGHRVALVGPGAIGAEIHALLAAVGCSVDCYGRQDVPRHPQFGRISSLAALPDALAEVDTTILALPLTSVTRGLVDARWLAAMRPGSTLVNIGRGALIDEAALIEALRLGRPGIAALDVFQQEPLPPGHPFWTMEQVYLSPHMSGDVEGWQQQAVGQFIANLARWCRGEALLNVVDKSKMR